MADALPKERKRRKWDEPAAPGAERALPSSANSRFSDVGPVHTQTFSASASQSATPLSNGMVQFNPAVLAGLNFSANFAIQPARPTVMDESALKVAQAAAAAVMARMVAQVRSILHNLRIITHPGSTEQPRPELTTNNSRSGRAPVGGLFKA